MSSNNDILLSLFTNLRNAAATFGTTSKQYQMIHTIVYDHLREMTVAGEKTDITGTKQLQQDDSSSLASAFEKLDLELKGQASGDLMEEPDLAFR